MSHVSKLRLVLLLALVTATAATAGKPLGTLHPAPTALEVDWQSGGQATGAPLVHVTVRVDGQAVVSRGRVGGTVRYDAPAHMSPGRLRDLLKQAATLSDRQSGGGLADPLMVLDVHGQHPVHVLLRNPAAATAAPDRLAWRIAREVLEAVDPEDAP